jgi:hypothetical protein
MHACVIFFAALGNRALWYDAKGMDCVDDTWPYGAGRLVCVDFDGVLCERPPKNPLRFDGLPGAPIDGAFAYLEALLLCGWRVAVHSPRSRTVAGVRCMIDFFAEHGHADLAGRIAWPTHRPAAWLTISDRVLPFDGRFPQPMTLHRFGEKK